MHLVSKSKTTTSIVRHATFLETTSYRQDTIQCPRKLASSIDDLADWSRLDLDLTLNLPSSIYSGVP